MLKNYEPIGERVIIKPVKKDNTTKSGISLGNDSPKFIEGIIVALSKHIKEPYYSIGEMVSYNKLKIEEISIEDEKYHMIHHLDVVAIIKNNTI